MSGFSSSLCFSLLLGLGVTASKGFHQRQITTTSAPTSTPTLSTVTISSTVCVAPATATMSYFHWFNSSHNLDCDNANFPTGSKVCWNGETDTLCETADPCICTDFCDVGLPLVAYQPYGWGPPDTLQIGFNGVPGEPSGCVASNPTNAGRTWELGEGHFDCGYGPDIMGFYGDSNADSGNNGSVYFNNYSLPCNFYYPQYTATFPLSCTRDEQNNATCVAPVPVVMTLAGWA
ncbi:hypothetical protein M406DRAFT_69121 [Cryphonectria parasitica EP155]|uniref:Uncharacterized protein n=1 Tax=Cryphonectria parasitica (strain ATCC 38755 / EP155) TaxID=660469 RepID=A0A9P4Y4S1_CRYP1|nr:uncharacterized protein M406DRAFT_69121 [Cryphonectria parasitica EP155]KAF3766944.1 hypothetical protein M406DRAFT_69121 [Cryphonectria parasitica EP155]